METEDNVSEEFFVSGASASEMVNATQARIREQCGCGAVYQATMPAEFRNDLIRAVNTWRKYHSCAYRQSGEEERPNGN
jgi:hypothetical protein